MQLVQPEEAVAQAEIEVPGAECLVQLPLPGRVELIEIEAARQRARGAVVVDDRERHKHRARPVAHVPEIHVEPFTDEEDLARDGRHMIPAHQADEGEVELGEGVHSRDAAQRAGHGASLEHTRVGGGEACQL